MRKKEKEVWIFNSDKSRIDRSSDAVKIQDPF